MMRSASACMRSAPVLTSSCTSSARSTLPCQRYTERTPGSTLTQAARRSPTSASAMREAVAASGQVQNARTTRGMAPIVRGRAGPGLVPGGSVHLAGRRLRGLEQRLRGPFGVVDERVAVALEAVDDFVALALGVVRWIGLVPGQQRRQQAHVGRRGRSLDDLAAVVGELQVRFGLSGVHV